MKRKVIFTITGIILLGVLTILFRPAPEEESYTLRRMDIEYLIPATCTVRYPEPYTTRAQAAGDVISLPVFEGQEVKQGDLLVQLDDFTERQKLAIALSDYENKKLKLVNAREENYPRLREQLNSARISLTEARDHAERLLRLYRAGGVSKVDWEQADSRNQQAQARFNQIKLQVDSYTRSGEAAELIQQLNAQDAQVRLARRAIADKHIEAPYAGLVIKIHVRRGETLRLGQDVVTMLEKMPWVLEASVDQKELPFLEAGLPGSVVFDAFPAETVKARVSLVCSVIDFAKGTCNLKIEVTENRPFIKHGMTGTIMITGKKREQVNANVLALPTRFLDRGSGGDFVMIEKKGKRELTAVTVVPIGEKWVSITNLPAGTRIILPE